MTPAPQEQQLNSNICLDWRIASLLAVVSFTLFILPVYQRAVLPGNEGAHFLTVRNLVRSNSFELVATGVDHGAMRTIRMITDGSIHNNTRFSNKPPGFPLMLYPVYKMYYSFLGRTDFINGFVFCRLFNSILASLSVVFTYLIAKIFFTTRLSGILCALLCGIGTYVYVYAPLLTSHCASVLLFTLSLLTCFHCIKSNHKSRSALLLYGIFSSYMIVVDYSNIPAIAPLSAYLLSRSVGRRLFYLLGPYLVTVSLLCLYQHMIFGSIWTLTYQHYVPPHYVQWDGPVHAFFGNWFRGFYGFLISPSRGIFVLSPALLFSFVFFFKKIRAKNTYAALLFTSFASMLFCMSFYKLWHGGNSMGYRHIIVIVPALAIPAGAAFSSLGKTRLRAVFIVLLALSVTTAFLASQMQKDSFMLKKTWKEEPRDIHSGFYNELLPLYLERLNAKK